MTSAQFAQLSNHLIGSAIVVYGLAFFAYVAEIAFGSRRLSVTSQAEAVLVGAGSRATPSVSGAVDGDGDAYGDASGGAPGLAERWGRTGVGLTVLAFLLHGGAVGARALSAHRVPWGNMYEFSTTGALAVVAVYLVLLRRSDVRYLGVLVVAAAVGTLAIAARYLYTESAALLPVLNSYWLVIHVVAAIVASGLFTVGAVTTVFYLLRSRAEARGRTDGWVGRLPASARLDELAYRLHAFAFPIWTFAVICGAIWAENAWGRYWGWDPKETWAFITWVVYACYLHARATAGWRGRGAAVIALVGYATFLFNYFGVNIFISGFHSYSGL